MDCNLRSNVAYDCNLIGHSLLANLAVILLFGFWYILNFLGCIYFLYRLFVSFINDFKALATVN